MQYGIKELSKLSNDETIIVKAAGKGGTVPLPKHDNATIIK